MRCHFPRDRRPRASILATLGLAMALGPVALFAEEPTTDSGSLPSAAELLKRFDSNRDGHLNERELSAGLAALRSPLAALAAHETKATAKDLEFVRVRRNEDQVAQSLDTSIVSFTGNDGIQVDLIGAIHVGDRAYYRELNRVFRGYDIVLYELVAPEGTRIPRGGGRSSHPIGRLQSLIKSMLNLSLQLEEIDYTVKHLVHADMSPAELAESMKARGESFWQIFFRLMTQAANQAQSKHAPSDRDLLMALFAPDRDLRLKRVMASQFENLETQMALFEGPNGSTIITERNKRVLEVLTSEMRKDSHRKIAIFYGAGHMADIAKRLQQELGMKPGETRWLQAWDMSDPKRR